MDTTHIETDYLVIGSGATAMAFVDTLLDESDASIVMVDRHHRPGGHWNDAYPFVRLHQPSAMYGVNSRELGSGLMDVAGLNEGLYELASGAEVVDYFEQVMNQRFLPSGRVRYFPMHHHEQGADGVHRFRSLVGGPGHTVAVRRKLVNATHARTELPATHPPKYRVAEGVHLVAPNELPRIAETPSDYVVIGSGKTGIDTCLWLLSNGAPPERIRWIMPRDPWLIDRANVQPGQDHLERFMGSLALQLEAIGTSSSIDELFARLERTGQLLRIDPSVQPSAYRCATVTQAELRELRRIQAIVRLGHVRAVEPGRIELEQGSIETEPGTLHVDCSASGLVRPPPVPVFDGDTINLLMVRTCQPVFSAALIGFVESRLDDEAARNALCQVVPSPERPVDWLRMWAVMMGNRYRWGRHEGVRNWLARSRLDNMTGTIAGVQPTETAKLAALERYRAAARQAGANLPKLLAAID